MPQRFADGLFGPTIKARHSPQVIVISVEALGRLALGAFDLRLLQLRRDSANHAGCYVVLQLEYVLEAALEAIRPQMSARRRVDELASDAQPIGRLAYATLEQVAHPELAADLLHVDRAALVGKGRVARDYEQPAHPGERRDDLLHDAVAEILLLGIAAHVLERQHGNRRFVRKGKVARRGLRRIALPAPDADWPRDVLHLLLAHV